MFVHKDLGIGEGIPFESCQSNVKTTIRNSSNAQLLPAAVLFANTLLVVQVS
jgi:hypothetical protein